MVNLIKNNLHIAIDLKPQVKVLFIIDFTIQIAASQNHLDCSKHNQKNAYMFELLKI